MQRGDGALCSRSHVGSGVTASDHAARCGLADALRVLPPEEAQRPSDRARPGRGGAPRDGGAEIYAHADETLRAFRPSNIHNDSRSAARRRRA
ncbi:hypothetical protein AAFF_G00273570 [Aldrovandia affinis]|uniref:Uncharacterized protein n=1 Tax=Aldrovandia affinis TaxID=143900 RepID=A0AAD7SRW7_9TELE|nr:hypothetical protein AAFF_G00273570 [Aldrovandia affinis]